MPLNFLRYWHHGSAIFYCVYYFYEQYRISIIAIKYIYNAFWSFPPLSPILPDPSPSPLTQLVDLIFFLIISTIVYVSHIPLGMWPSLKGNLPIKDYTLLKK